MATMKYKPTTPSRRNMMSPSFDEVTKFTPEKSLLAKKKKNADADWTAIRQVDTKNKPRCRIARHYAALLRISNGVRPFFISMRW